jgi:hypothetical protein
MSDVEIVHLGVAPDRVKKLVDERLYDTYWRAVEHFGTTDLVVFLETERVENAVNVLLRKTVIEDFDASSRIVEMMSVPASEMGNPLGEGASTFWFVAIFSDGASVVRVVAKRLSGDSSVSS